MINDSRSQFRDTKTPAASGVTCCGWLEIKHSLAFPDDLGQTEPAAGAKFEVTTPTGEIIEGELDAEGFALIPGAGHGVANIEIEPHIDDEIQTLQAEIITELKNLVETEKQETEKIEKEYDEANWAGKRWKDSQAAGRGIINVFGSIWDLLTGIGNALSAVAGQAGEYLLDPLNAPETFKKDVAAIKAQYQELKEFADEDLELYFLFMADDQTWSIFQSFGQEYLSAQHYSEYIEGGASGVFGVILSILTAGAGAAVMAGTAGARLATVGSKLSPLVQKLAKLLKRKRAKTGTRSETNRRVESENELNRGRIGGRAVSNDIPEHTYRGDSRSPDEIFDKGFEPKARGSNTSLEDYARNNTSSDYVGTSKDPNVAKDFADSDGYVYTIKSDKGIDVNKELGNKSPFPNEQEVVIPGGIKPENIKGATPVNKNGNFGNSTVLNPNHYKKIKKD